MAVFLCSYCNAIRVLNPYSVFNNGLIQSFLHLRFDVIEKFDRW